jgi:hypothetical protein
VDSGANRRRTGLFGAFCWLASVAVISVVALIVWWLVHANGSLTLPRFSTTGPVVRNGVAVIVACGKKSGIEGVTGVMDYAPEPGTGTWAHRRRGDCTVWYHDPPRRQQREARQQRAQQHADR